MVFNHWNIYYSFSKLRRKKVTLGICFTLLAIYKGVRRYFPTTNDKDIKQLSFLLYL